MKDQYGNYIVQRAIELAKGPQRDIIKAKLEAEIPDLSSDTTHGIHIVQALERTGIIKGALRGEKGI